MRLLILLSVLLLFSCRSGETIRTTDGMGRPVIEEYYGNKQLRSKTVFYNEAQRNYLHYSFYSDGRLKDSALFVHDTVNGLRKFYERKSALTHYETYRNGILEGLHKAIYDNGTTSFEGVRLNGLKVGEWLFHYLDGSLITYEYYDSLGNIRFFRKYGENEKLVKQNGNAIIKIYPDSVALAAGAVYSGIAEVATPPGYAITLKAGVMSGDALVSDTVFPVTGNLVPFMVKSGHSGPQTLHFTLSFKGDDPQDSFTFNSSLQVTHTPDE